MSKNSISFFLQYTLHYNFVWESLCYLVEVMSAITVAYHFNHNTYSILISHYYILGIALQSERKKGVFKQRRFWETQDNRKRNFFHLSMPWNYQIIISLLIKPLPNNVKYSQLLADVRRLETSLGSIWVPGKLPTYPSPRQTLTLTCHLGQYDGLGEG